MKKILLTATLVAALSTTMAGQVNQANPEGYLERAGKMYDDANYVGIVDQLQYYKQQAPDGQGAEEADYLLALASMRLKRVDGLSLCRYFLWKYPVSPRRWEVRLTMAEGAMSRDDYGMALAETGLIDPARLDGEQVERYDMVRGLALLNAGRRQEAAGLFGAIASSRRYGNDARFYQGYIAYLNGDYTRAKSLLSEVSTRTMPGSMADYYLAQIAFAERDFGRALTLAERTLKNKSVHDTYRAEALRVAGESEYNLGNDSRAVELLGEYLSLASEPMPSALYILGVNAYRVADYPTAVDYLGRVADEDNAMGQSALLTIGEALMAQGNNSGAMIALEKAYKMGHDPEISETALYNYAVARTEGGRVPFGSTVTTFEDFLRQYPASPHAQAIRRYLVKGYITDNNLPAALASINAIAKPDDEILRAKQLVLYTLGSRETAAGQLTAAVDHLKQARALAKYDAAVAAETDLWLGDAVYAQDDYAEAARMYASALKSKSLSEGNRPLATYNMGYAMFNQDKRDEATEWFSRYVSASGTSPARMVADAYNRLGDIKYANSEFGRAQEDYSKALQLSQSTGDYPLFQIAMTRGLTGDPEGKINDLQTMMRKYNDSPLMARALLETGITYDRLNRPDKTIETYSQLATRYPATPQGREAMLLMALTYINNGNERQAEQSYRELIARAPKSEEATQAIESLKNMMAEQGRLGEFNSFMTSVPEAGGVDKSDLEATAFAAAERQYLTNGTTARLIDYIDHFEGGVNMPKALYYTVKGNAAAGNNIGVLKYGQMMIENYRDNELAPEVMLIVGDTRVLTGEGEEALKMYDSARESATNPAEVNRALIGITRTGRVLEQNERVIEAAETLLGSSTPTAEQMSEAAFARGLALAQTGRRDEALAQWSLIADNLDDVNGAKAAYYIALEEFEAGDVDKAQKSVEALIDSDTPHIYWLARGFILLSDIHRARGNNFEADQYLKSLRDNYPGSEPDIINLIDTRLK